MIFFMNFIKIFKKLKKMFAFLLAAATSKVFIQLNEERSFIHWMRTHNQFYTGDEYHFRLGLYLCRTRWINDFNKGQHTFTVGHNKFSTYTPAEMNSLLGANPKSANSMKSYSIQKFLKKQNKGDAPESLDWRDKGVLNSVRDQAKCGSCWAFSAIATCEAAYAIHSNQLLAFSEQNLVDCADWCDGCAGGWPSSAINYVIAFQNGQFNSQTDYPYEAVQQDCRFDSSKAIGQVSLIVDVNSGDENDLRNRVFTFGVAAVAIDASASDFHAYTSGIYYREGCSTSFLDHAVAVVGYGSESGNEYWIVRNSWVSAWGESGYIRMSRNKNNMCGIATQAIIAMVY
ncbi:Digestive cysteine proteinase 2 [Tritrichomonas foetus]|uniref:Digestive cysteine proteinase 2 n=1 Tax=Tritrichomonas foetus TaxID=1144522 RepID=A0A1J4JXB8_9EUKA|nr:Digestive cysteine proteinase 2 [Tritrichomonas foetus]|eukprot:OHT02182.1 Digestive cysteine proteinase 2 [Tritrichomonas foetus]